MHGLANYTAQETSHVFVANRTYTFAVHAQNDEVLDNTNGLFMYIFDCTVPFSDANALASSLTTDIPSRGPLFTAEDSQKNWKRIFVTHTVSPGAPEIGHPIGVGFFARRDTAVDDASLLSTPEPTSIVLAGLGGVAALGLRRRK
jgi:hypothetical protein